MVKFSFNAQYLGNGYLKTSLHVYYEGKIMKTNKKEVDTSTAKVLPICVVKKNQTFEETAKQEIIYEEQKPNNPLNLDNLISKVKNSTKQEEETTRQKNLANYRKTKTPGYIGIPYGPNGER